jgi:hypothetical protein
MLVDCHWREWLVCKNQKLTKYACQFLAFPPSCLRCDVWQHKAIQWLTETELTDILTEKSVRR